MQEQHRGLGLAAVERKKLDLPFSGGDVRIGFVCEGLCALCFCDDEALSVVAQEATHGAGHCFEVPLLHAVEQVTVDASGGVGVRPQGGAYDDGLRVAPEALRKLKLERPRATENLQVHVASHALRGAPFYLNTLQDSHGVSVRDDDVHAPDVAREHVVVGPTPAQDLAKDVADVVEHGAPVVEGRGILKRLPQFFVLSFIDDLQRATRVRQSVVVLDLVDAAQSLRPRRIHWIRWASLVRSGSGSVGKKKFAHSLPCKHSFRILNTRSLRRLLFAFVVVARGVDGGFQLP